MVEVLKKLPFTFKCYTNDEASYTTGDVSFVKRT